MLISNLLICKTRLSLVYDEGLLRMSKQLKKEKGTKLKMPMERLKKKKKVKFFVSFFKM